MTTTIELQRKLALVEQEMNTKVKERGDVIHGIIVGRVIGQHVLMVGPGGTGKSYLARTFWSHIGGARKFEYALDESTDPSRLLGPPDLKVMAEEGRTRIITDGKLPWATDGFLDEFFNGNQPTLHAIMPLLNERVLHNDGVVERLDLAQCLMGTNKLNADVEMAALWDRVHLRYRVRYLISRDNMNEMAAGTLARLRSLGRSDEVRLPGEQPTIVTLEEWDQARDEALALPIPDDVMDAFWDLREELQKGDAGVEVSDRRAAEGLVAVVGNAYVRGHNQATIGDLDILANMWWNLLESEKAVRTVVLSVANPNEKIAMELLDDLDEQKEEWAAIQTEDESKWGPVAIECVKACERIVRTANTTITEMERQGQATYTMDDVINRTNDFRRTVSKDAFGLDESALVSLAGVR